MQLVLVDSLAVAVEEVMEQVEVVVVSLVSSRTLYHKLLPLSLLVVLVVVLMTLQVDLVVENQDQVDLTVVVVVEEDHNLQVEAWWKGWFTRYGWIYTSRWTRCRRWRWWILRWWRWPICRWMLLMVQVVADQVISTQH